MNDSYQYLFRYSRRLRRLARFGVGGGVAGPGPATPPPTPKRLRSASGAEESANPSWRDTIVQWCSTYILSYSEGS